MARVKGYLAQYEIRRTSDPGYSMDIDGRMSRSRISGTEMTFTLLVESGEGDARGLSSGDPVVLHNGSCDADRLGALEKERDEWRRRAEQNELAADLFETIKYSIPRLADLAEAAGFEVVGDPFGRVEIKKRRPMLGVDAAILKVNGMDFAVKDFKVKKTAEKKPDPAKETKLRRGDLVAVPSMGGVEGWVFKFQKTKGWRVYLQTSAWVTVARDGLAFIERGTFPRGVTDPEDARFNGLDLGDDE